MTKPTQKLIWMAKTLQDQFFLQKVQTLTQITETEEEVDPDKCLEGVNLFFYDKSTGIGLVVSTNGKENNLSDYTPPVEIPSNSHCMRRIRRKEKSGRNYCAMGGGL
ncbi:hypothetical protein PanWU01x14_242460 [Parasponia andersonii]|uniref:Uncharacterized protein n=1 Tax=Parasponia andersonii TaxID=3476 RepID=A0A2P5BG04_PARAD|nr:hypothetical protein PanWU01x14_242460 [Parasponia andersonii]